jgi:hypothetical protein
VARHGRDAEPASAESARRRALAAEMAERAPPGFAVEIALTGSAALGVADARSDLELNLWGEALPAPDARRGWLAALGAADVALAVEDGPDGTLWETWRYRGVWVEAGWQTLAAQERNLAALLTGAVHDHEHLLVAGAALQAVPLRTAGHLAAWQTRLADYPDGLAERITRAAVDRWQWPHWVALRWAYAERGEMLAHAGCLAADLRAALRVLFAANRRWESGWKWLRPAVRDLPRRPDRLIERIDALLADPDPAGATRASLTLVLDCLALAAALPEVARARELITASLAAEPAGR